MPNVGLKLDVIDNLSDKSLSNLIHSLDDTALSTMTVRDAIDQLTTKTITVTEKVKKSSTVFKAFAGVGKAFASTMGNIALSMVASWAIEKGIEFIYNLVNATEIAIQKGQEAAQTIKDIQSEMNTKTTFVEDSGARFGELREGVDAETNENISLTNEEYTEYLSLCDQIADIYPELVVSYDEQGTAILNLGADAESTTNRLKEMLEVDQQLANLEIGKNTQTVHEGYLEEIEKYNSDKARTSNNISAIEENDIVQDTIDLMEQLEKIRSGEQAFLQVDGQMYSNVINSLKEMGVGNYKDEGGLITFEVNALFDREKLVQDLEESLNIMAHEMASSQALDKTQNIFEQSLIDAKIENTWQNMLGNFVDSAKANANYTNLGEAIQNGINSVIGELNYSDFLDENGLVTLGDYEDVNDFVESEFIAPIAYAFVDLNTDNPVFKNAQKQAQGAFNSLFSLDKSKLNTEEYSSIVSQNLDIIESFMKTAFPEDGEERFQEFAVKFGFRFIDEHGAEVDVARNRKYSLKELAASRGEDISNLELDDLTVDQIVEIETIYKDVSNGQTLQEIVDSYIREQKNAIDTEPITFASLLEDKDGTLSTTVDNFQTATSSIQSALDSLAAGEKIDLTDLIQEFPELASQTKNLEDALTSLKEKKLNTVISDIISSARKSGISEEEWINVGDFIKGIVDSVDISNIDLTDAKNDLIKSLLDSVMLGDYMEDINSWFAELTTPRTLPELVKQDWFTSTISQYQSVYTQLKEAQDKIAAGTFTDSDFIDLTNTFPELASETGDLSDAIEELLDTADGNILEFFTEKINDLRDAGMDEEADALQNYANRLMESVNQIEEAATKIGGMTIKTPGLDAYENAVNSVNEGATYKSLKSALEATKELYDQGFIGTDEFKKGAALFSPTGAEDPVNFLENYGKAARYLTEDISGAVNFLEDLESKGYATSEMMADGTKSWTYNIQDLQIAAKDMGMSFEWFMGMFGELSDRGFVNDFVGSTDEGIEHLSDLYGQLADAEADLIKLEREDPGNTTAIQAKIAEIDTLHGRINTTKEALQQLLTVGTEDAETQVKAGKAAIASMREELSSLDPDDENYESIKAIIEEQIQDIADAYHIDLKADLTVDDPEADAEVERIRKKYQSQVNLTTRPLIDAETMRNAGYSDVEDDSYATVYSMAGSTEDGRKTVVVTPILPDGTVISEDELGKYIDQALSGIEPEKPVVLATFDGENSIQQANDYSEALHLVQEAYYGEDKSLKSMLYTLNEYTAAQLESIDLQDGQWDQNGLAQAEQSLELLLDTFGLTYDQAYALIGVLEQMNLLNIAPEANVEELSSGVEDGISDAQQSAESNPIIVPMKIKSEDSGVPSIEETANNQSPLTYALNLNTEYYDSQLDQTIEETNSEEGTVIINGDNGPAKQATDEAVSYIESQNPKMKVQVDFEETREMVKSALREPFEIAVRANVTGLPNSGSSNGSQEDGAHSLHGTAHAYGTFNSSLARSHSFGRACMTGDWGVKKSGNTLVGELGTEIVVDPHTGRWYTVGDNGAEFVDLPENAIVFNHVQSQSLLENGYVNTRGKALAGGNAYFEGNAFGGGGGGGSTTIQDPSPISESAKETAKSLKDAADASDKVSKEFQDLIDKLNDVKDWVEVDLSRLQSRIDLQLAKGENEIGYQDKNRRVQNAQNLTSKLIKDTKKGLAEYEDYAAKFAKDSGMSKKLVDKVRNGTIDIKKLSEKEKLQVEGYTQWYEKIIQCKQSIEELKKSQEELAQQKLDNIVNRYDGIISHIEDRIAGIDNDIALAEAKGFADSGVYYEAKAIETNKAKAKKAAEIKALEDSLANDIASGKIVAPGKDSRGSEAWYEMQGLINDTKLEYEELEIQAQEYLNTQREINWAHEDAVQQNIQRINDEADFYKKLMQDEDRYDEDGNVTEHGKAMYGLEAVSYNVNMKDAEMYGKRKEELAKELALPKNKGNQKLIDEYNRLEEAQRGCILAAKDNKQAMVDYVKEGIEKQLAALQKLIDKYMDAIQSQKDMYDYQNNVQEQTEEIAKLQKRLAAYAGDDSEAGRLKRQETEKELKEAQKQLEETQYDKFISDQQDMLDDLYKEYEDVLNDRLENIDELIKDVIAGVNGEEGSIQATITAAAASVGTTLSDSFKGIFNEGDGQDAVDDDPTDGVDPNTGVGDGIEQRKNEQENIHKESDDNANEQTGQTNEDYPTTDDKGNHESAQGYKDGIAAILSTNGKKHDKPITEDERKSHSDLWNYVVENFGYTLGAGGTEKLARYLDVDVSKNLTDKDKDKVLKALIEKTGGSGVEDTFKAKFDAIIKTGEKRKDGKITEDEKKKKSDLWKYIVKKYKVVPVSGMMESLGKLFGVKDINGTPTDKQKNEILKAMKARGYATGTRSTDDEWAWMNENGQEIVTRPDGSILMPFAKGSGVINNPKTEQLLNLANNHDAIMEMLDLTNRQMDIARAQQNAATAASLTGAAVAEMSESGISSGENSTVVENHISIHVNGVSNMAEFLTELQHSGEFEKLITSMTAERINGKSKLSKFKHNFS